MKKNGILNSDISRVIFCMGHTDTLCIGDCGLPIPNETERIDLSLSLGEPGFLRVFEVVLSDLKVEKLILAKEIKDKNPEILKGIEELAGTTEIVFVPHEELKKMTHECKAVIRTGENTPYSNVIMQSSCIFD